MSSDVLSMGHLGLCIWYLLVLPLTSLIILISYLYLDLPLSDPVEIIICLGAKA